MSEPQHVLVTGSSGLVGSETVAYYSGRAQHVYGMDNNTRGTLFGSGGDTAGNLRRLQDRAPNFLHRNIDIRDRHAVAEVFQAYPIDLVIHCAAQPSHDLAGTMPWHDFQINAVGTLHLLEATRQYRPEAVFIFLSTNKVYGDAPNEYPLVERETRWDYEQVEDRWGIDEGCRIDQSLHSLFGASKLAADVMTQEYGRYYGMKTGVFRAGCLTGPNHAGVKLHGFLSYLVKVAVDDGEYTIIGHKGKQVRDQLHSADVVAACDAFAGDPRPGEVYNLGGGRENSVSILECITMIEERLGRPLRRQYVDKPRRGDHICYISDTSKLSCHFPHWKVSRTLDDILDEMIHHAEGGKP